MLFEAGNVRLWVSAKYVDSDTPMQERKMLNGEQIFVAEPNKDFEIIMVSLGYQKQRYACALKVGEYKWRFRSPSFSHWLYRFELFCLEPTFLTD